MDSCSEWKERYCERPNGLELSFPAEAGNAPSLYGHPAAKTSIPEGAARRVSLS